MKIFVIVSVPVNKGCLYMVYTVIKEKAIASLYTKLLTCLLVAVTGCSYLPAVP